jgi:hypothetical protein
MRRESRSLRRKRPERRRKDKYPARDSERFTVRAVPDYYNKSWRPVSCEAGLQLFYICLADF